MQQHVTRQDLYDLAWSEPMRTLAKRFGISDVALAKTCRHMHVPIPPRGFWAKKAAGKPASKLELPPRPVGLDDEVTLGGGRYARYYQHSLTQDEILGPIPPEPKFTETMEDVRERLAAALPKVAVPRDLGAPHPAVAKLLTRDDEKRDRQKNQSYVPAWDTPLYDTPVQKRRLRLLSAIFLALAREGCRTDTWGSHPYTGTHDEFAVTVGSQCVRLRASVVETRTPARAGRPATTSAKLRLVINPGENGRPDGQSWEDGEVTLEQQARGIALAIMLKGEQQHRDGAVRVHAWRVDLKAKTIERLENERLEAEQKERERQAALERRRVERLLGDADAFRRARDIRAYVDEARAANRHAPDPIPVGDMEVWAGWALAQADRIDPVRTGAFRSGDDGKIAPTIKNEKSASALHKDMKSS